MTDAGRWRVLDEHLEGRRDWHFENDRHNGPMWCFGQDGEFHLFDYDNDIDRDVRTIEAVKVWVEENEPSHAGLSEKGQALRDAVLVMETEQWLGQLGEE